jgi:hypothetical protein
VYRHILRTYYDMEVSQMLLASFHPELSSYFLAEIPAMDKEVQTMVCDLRSRADQPPNCAPANTPATKPVE